MYDIVHSALGRKSKTQREKVLLFLWREIVWDRTIILA